MSRYVKEDPKTELALFAKDQELQILTDCGTQKQDLSNNSPGGQRPPITGTAHREKPETKSP